MKAGVMAVWLVVRKVGLMVAVMVLLKVDSRVYPKAAPMVD